MDKQTAIDLLDNLLGMVEDNHDSDYDTAIKMGIDALQSNAPNALSALDCVERQAAVDAIRAKDDYSNVAVAIGLGKAITAICELPSVQPQRMSTDKTCDSCRYRYNEWDEEPCDGCTPNDSRYCPDTIEVLPPISKREWYQKGYEAGVKSVQPQRWIPVTERLPEEKQDVLLAFKHNMVVGFWEDILNDGGQAWYANSGNGWFTGTEAVDDDGFPLAWMPLPESYKGEQDET